MSKCISQRGEYSEHEAGEGGWCVYCGDLDLAAHDAEVEARVRGEVAAAIRAAQEDPPAEILSRSQQAAWKIGMARAHSIARAARIAEGRES